MRKGKSRRELRVEIAPVNDESDALEVLDSVVLTGEGLYERGADTSRKLAPCQLVWSDLADHRLLARGNFGAVYSAVLPCGTAVAVKKLNGGTHGQIGESLSAVRREVEWVRSGCNPDRQHPNLLQSIDAFYVRDTKEVWVVMELMELGSLSSVLSRLPQHSRRFLSSDPAKPELGAAALAVQAFAGLGFLHKGGVLHRDIKPDNVLVNVKGFVKLGDFGLSKHTTSASMRTNTWVGTACYMSPEKIDVGDGAYGPASDVWGLGLVIAECATGRPAWTLLGDCDAGDNPRDIIELSGRIKLGLSVADSSHSPAFAEFIRGATAVDEAGRWSCDRLLEHHWIKDHFESGEVSPQRSVKLSLHTMMKATGRGCKEPGSC